MSRAPARSISSRSNPSATPDTGGRPAASAASSASSISGGRQAAAPALLPIGFESRALLGCVRKLLEAIGELDAAVVELEAQRDARIVGVEARQRRLAGRIAVHEAQPVGSQPRARPRCPSASRAAHRGCSARPARASSRCAIASARSAASLARQRLAAAARARMPPRSSGPRPAPRAAAPAACRASSRHLLHQLLHRDSRSDTTRSA